jgi:prophage DNA circulation protein
MASGSAIAQGALLAVRAWGATAVTLSRDAALAAGAMSVLPGNYGRYVSNGAVPVQNTATVASVLASLSAARTAVGTASATVQADAADLTSANAGTLVADIAALAEALRAVAVDPSDQIRLMIALENFYPTPAVSSAAIGQTIAAVQTETGAVCRRAALVSLARACAAYTPTSYNDALTLRDNVATLIQNEIIMASTAGDTNAYAALRALRTAVITDLTARGANLPQLVEVTTRVPMPSLALAYQLYGDATRSDDLVQRAAPICSLWMPTDFVALSS